jgi:hypothetical protein
MKILAICLVLISLFLSEYAHGISMDECDKISSKVNVETTRHIG